jgi:hypothetical protein
LVSALQSCGLVAPLPFVLDVSPPLVAVIRSPSPDAPFVLAFSFLLSLLSALNLFFCPPYYRRCWVCASFGSFLLWPLCHGRSFCAEEVDCRRKEYWL